MASGYKDYVRNVAPEFFEPGAGQTLIQKMEGVTVTAFDTAKVITYNIPAGYNFHILHAGISCEYPGCQIWGIYQASTTPFAQVYDTTVFVSFGGEMVLYRADGDEIGIIVTNQENRDIYFYAMFRGFIKPIET